MTPEERLSGPSTSSSAPGEAPEWLAEGLASIECGLADVAAGRVRPFREAIHEIAEQLGVKLDDGQRRD